MKRLMVLGTTAVLLGGCALPVPVQIASWALDGLSYLMTEKTIADHGISVLAQKDCAVLRGLLDDGQFCRDYDAAGIMVADADAGFAFIDDGDDEDDGDQLAALTDDPDSIDFDAAPGTFARTSAGPLATTGDAATDARPIIDDGVEIAVPLTYQPLFFEDGPPLFFEDGPQLAGYPLEIAATPEGPIAPVRQEARADNGEGSKDRADGKNIANFETAAGPESNPESGLESSLGETLEVASNLSQPFVDETTVVALPEPAPAAAETTPRDWQAETIMTVKTPGMTGKTVKTAKTVKPEFEPGRELGREPEAGLYFVIGSFRQHENARKLRSQYRILTPSVLAANLEQGIVFRVVVGPFEQANAKRVHRSIYRAGITDSWAIRVQPGEWSMALVDAPAEAPMMAEPKTEPRPLTAMDYVQLLAQLIH